LRLACLRPSSWLEILITCSFSAESTLFWQGWGIFSPLKWVCSPVAKHLPIYSQHWPSPQHSKGEEKLECFSSYCVVWYYMQAEGRTGQESVVSFHSKNLSFLYQELLLATRCFAALIHRPPRLCPSGQQPSSLARVSPEYIRVRGSKHRTPPCGWEETGEIEQSAWPELRTLNPAQQLTTQSREATLEAYNPPSLSSEFCYHNNPQAIGIAP
jgi:hypothetical protein